ncbi:putative mitochondrial pyruvate carrier 2 [Golovinomyces cichoracearum]|uniref:Mitochondrial pyruvate carrier n=1 Tax=Golovinomyces cichoracearum TaxID=62708 RepID=A0A420IIR4_9PEZI|nr:putative mitochondrial pyruvate carrier 2 [Golovinomyces cichoracearum]
MFHINSSALKAVRPTIRSAAAQSQCNSNSGVTRQFQRNARRWTSSVAPENTSSGWLKKMWNSPVGLKTWSIVLAGISDLYRPVEKLSLTQNLALTSTGLIWTRWCFIIKPRNILLATVNFFLGLVGIIQVTRIAANNYSNDKATETKLLPSSDSPGAIKITDPKADKAD